MSDSYQITLGLGTPASIPRFMLFGLATKIVGVIYGTLHERYHLSGTLDDRDLSGGLHNRPHNAGTLDDRDLSGTLQERAHRRGTVEDRP